jgi:hypothetical protein
MRLLSCGNARALHAPALPPRSSSRAHASALHAPRQRRQRAHGLQCVAGAPAALLAAASPLYVCGDLSTTLFTLGQQADALVNANLTTVTPATYAVVLVRAHATLRACAHSLANPACRGLTRRHARHHARRLRAC